jgi:hypothetical protein
MKTHWTVSACFRAELSAVLLLIASVVRVNAAQFLYGNLTWATDGPQRRVAFRFTAAFRRSDFTGTALDGRPKVGDVISDSSSPTGLDFGDNTSVSALRFQVTQISTNDDYVVCMALDPSSGAASIRHRYPSRGPYLAIVHGLARPANLNNRAGEDYRLVTLVKLDSRNSAALSALPPIVTVPSTAATSFFVAAIDPNGDRLRWRLAEDAEAGGGSSPPNLSVAADTGQITWNNVGLDTTNPWTVQIIVEDLDTSGDVRGYNTVDFLLRINAATNPPPTCSANPPGPFTVSPGTMVAFNIAGTDANSNQPITLNSGLLPGSAVLNPPLPLTGTSGISSTFSWVPGAEDVGEFVLLFSASDASGQAAQCFVTVNVVDPLHVVQSAADCAHGTVSIQFNRPVQLAGSFSFTPAVTVLGTNYGAGMDEIVLLTGSLKPGTDYGLTISGIHDLTSPSNSLVPDPTLTVVNCSDSCGPLEVGTSFGFLQLEWTGSGTVLLQTSTNLIGWVGITNAASPYLVSPGSLARQFFRIRCVNNGPGPWIVEQPQSQLTGLGAPAHFSVVAGGQALKYQWSFNGTNLTGATSSDLILNSVNSNRVGVYQVLVTNSFGNVLSAPAYLALSNDTGGLVFNTSIGQPLVSILLISAGNTAGFPLNTTVAQPPASVLFVGAANPGMPLNTTVAQPPASVLLVGAGNPSLLLNTTIAQPPASVLLVGAANPGLSLSTTIAEPPAWLLLCGSSNTGSLLFNTTVAQPPTQVGWEQ